MQKIYKALIFAGESPLAAFVNAIDRVLDNQHEGGPGRVAADVARGVARSAARDACQALLHYLRDLDDGLAPHPLCLFGAYKALLTAAGQERIHPVDLAFPQAVSESELRFPFADEAASAAQVDLAACRTGFEKALLSYLRTSDAGDGARLLRDMAGIVGKVSNASAVSSHSGFWRIVSAAVALFANGEIHVDQYAKKFLGQINLQLRRLVSGAFEGDARLLREGVFFVALAPVSNVVVQAIKHANALPDLRQADYQHGRDATPDTGRMTPSAPDPRETALTELATALTRAEALIESSFNGERRHADIADIIRDLAATADRVKLDGLAELLRADMQRIEKIPGADEDETAPRQSPAISRAIRNLAALSLSLPLMRHTSVMPYRARHEDDPGSDSDVLAPAMQLKPVEQISPAAVESVAVLEPAEEDLDLELLDIFLTEADDILNTLGKTLDASRHARNDMAHIIVLRRGFHTLKGSCRMVGLNAMSDGAMAMESFLNDWLTAAAPGTDADYALLDYAKHEVAVWVDEIREKGKSGRRPDAIVSAVESARQSAQDALLSVPTIRLGDVEIPLRLHQIYCDESAALLDTMYSHLAQWERTLPGVIAPEMLRATHSLKSSSASVRFAVLQVLAQALDDVMQFLERFPGLLDADVCASLLQLVRQLQTMQQAFASGRMPPAREDLQQQLQAMLDSLKLQSTDAPAPGRQHQDAALVAPPSAGNQESATSGKSEVREDGGSETCIDLIDEELLEIFLEEGRDLLPQIGESLYKLQKSPDDRGIIQYLLRPLHTIKGSARMAGAMRLGQHMHELETCIDDMVREGMPSAAQIDDLLARYDHGLLLFEALETAPTPAPLSVPQALPPSPAPVANEQSSHANAKPGPQIVAPGVESAAPADTDAGKNIIAAPLVRIRAGILDSLLNQAGEISISRSGLESEVNVLRQHLADLGSNVARLTTQLREVEIQAEIQIAASNQRQPQNQHFDPLEFDRFTHLQEMTRMLAESVNDVASLQKNLLETVDHTQNSLTQQARLTREMQQELMQARMVQFRGVEERLHRLVRQMAKETGKELELEIVGSAVELDRSILEKMVGPFEHLLRNAAVHGIETAAQRRQSGKPAVGHLSLEVRQEGYEVMIRLSDDGQGLNLARIQEKAVRLGLIDPAQQLSDAELTGLIFQPGFTTSADVTAIAGRGVGMDVVRSEIASLGGRISIDTVAGKGATFIIHLPLSLAVTQVVLLELGAQTYGIPSLLVEQVLQLKAADQAELFREGTLDWQGRKLPMHYLPALLGEDKGVPAQQTLPILVVKSGHDFLAILVDRIIGNREVVTKNIGPQLAHMVGVVGATVLGSGNIALILNPIQLAQRHGYQKVLRQLEPAATDRDSSKKTILVVDDSLTVRRVMQRLLTREGYHVVLATDGVDALHQLQDMRPDIALIDIEMPRMDGFDLTRNIRDMDSTATLPIIMITSRTAAKHRERAMELGVNEYLGKPYQDEVLLKMIRQLIGDEGEQSGDGIAELLFPSPPDGAALPQADAPGA
ncbi:Hpt domain-containing protein [Herbaspirillum rhizosphaerae]|uniref:hybrid sensor histidine kinase/response regulator n=1 Tax=Herbaspirillum rhizosphaerae TaxID=346179 RepID=UPI000AE6326E|nr:Hpt domain-containing protein [Herbaspirillum rhizosphaerae]